MICFQPSAVRRATNRDRPGNGGAGPAAMLNALSGASMTGPGNGSEKTSGFGAFSNQVEPPDDSENAEEQKFGAADPMQSGRKLL